MILNKKICVASVVTCLSFTSITLQASPIQIIDNGTFTTDTVSGLDWLDVSLSTNQSYNYVNSQFGNGGEYQGWHYATGLEVFDLVTRYADIPNSQFAEITRINHESIAGIMDLLGGPTWEFEPDDNWRYFQGLFKDTDSDHPHGLHYQTADLYLYQPLPHEEDDGTLSYLFVNSTSYAPDRAESYFGSYLIRNSDGSSPPPIVTPIPGSVWFLSSGLLALIGFSHKKNKNLPDYPKASADGCNTIRKAVG